MIESVERLRESSHLDDDKWTLETGAVVNAWGSKLSDPNAINWGEQWRKIADEIEAEIAEKYMALPLDADGVPIHVGDVLEIADSGIEDDGPETVKSVSSGLVWFGGTMGIMGGAFRHAKSDKLSELLERFAEAIDETAGRKANENESLTAGEWEELVRDEAGYYAEIIREMAERGEL